VAALTRKLTIGNERRAEKGLPLQKGLIFCDRHCHGAWFGTVHGWGTRPHPIRRDSEACTRGHLFTAENTYAYTSPTTGKTHRQCLACKKERYAAKKEEIKKQAREYYRIKKEKNLGKIASVTEPVAPDIKALELGMKKVRMMIQKARSK
jgi:hypothetical protein